MCVRLVKGSQMISKFNTIAVNYSFLVASGGRRGRGISKWQESETGGRKKSVVSSVA